MWREAAIGVLGVLMLALLAALAAILASPGSASGPGAGTAANGRIDSAIGATMRHFELAMPLEKPAQQRLSPAVRRELRVRVPESFPSLLFNHALDSAIRPLGARVIGAENSQEKRVAIHIRKDGVILRTLILQESNEQ